MPWATAAAEPTGLDFGGYADGFGLELWAQWPSGRPYASRVSGHVEWKTHEQVGEFRRVDC
jgi:hypothetical protein